MGHRDFDLQPHLDALRRYARVLTRAGQEADDLVQGALLKAYERRASFRSGSSLRVWLMSILHNHFIDQLRSKRASMAREQAWAELNPGFSTPDSEQAVRLAQLRLAFLDLPPDQREALHLVAMEGLSIAEAAAVLQIPPGTVMSRLGRARMALRRFEDGPPQADAGESRVPQGRPGLRLVGGRDDR